MNEIHLPSIDSTNTYAKQHVAEFDPKEITCILAETQTGGRGRFEKHWVSPPGVNLYLTFYFRLPLAHKDLGSLGLILASSMAKILPAEGVQIKWPNDLHLGGKKFGGVLCETSVHKDGLDVFAGIGVNVNMELKDLVTISQSATSLKMETKQTWDRQKLCKLLQTQFAHDLELFLKDGFAPFHVFCENILAYKGLSVRCFQGTKEWIGVCDSLASDGRLNLRLPDHSLLTLSAGELSLRAV